MSGRPIKVIHNEMNYFFNLNWWIGQKLSPRPENSKIQSALFRTKFKGKVKYDHWRYSMASYNQEASHKLSYSWFKWKSMLFRQSWVRAFQALPNSVIWSPNSGILILVSSSMTRKPIKCFHQSSNHFFSLILHLPIDSLHDLQGKIMSFTGKLFQT